MTTAEDVFEFLAEQSSEKTQWGRPFSVSVLLHAILFLLLPWIWELRPEKPLEPVKVLEINIMGKQDLALKGTGQDFGLGPLRDKSVMANPAKDRGPVARGNTRKVSRSLRAAVRATTAPPSPPRLSARGPLFSMKGGPVAAQAGVGREKIYVPSGGIKLAGGGSSSKEPSAGEGLVGVSGGTIDLKARRGGGGEGGNGGGNFLGGGEGSVDGGSILQRQGEPILLNYPTVSDDPIVDKGHASSVGVPDAPDDAFFSIRGPLGRRRILKINLPKYPRWAEESGVEAQVAVRLTVTSNGRVKPNAYIERTSGFPELDGLVLEAVKKIQFAPLSYQDNAREEWGIATFNFKLKRSMRG